MRNHEKETERNYEKEIENLLRDIEVLELQKSAKETQLQRVQRDRKRNDQKKKATQASDERYRKQNEQKKKATQALDESGRVIQLGDRVTATTTGKFKEKTGIVTEIKKWVTYTDKNGVKQTRAPANLRVEDV